MSDMCAETHLIQREPSWVLFEHFQEILLNILKHQILHSKRGREIMF